MDNIIHTLKKWEKKYGYIGLKKDELKVFSKLKGKKFTIRVAGKILYKRSIDSYGRVYLSKKLLESFKEGDELIISISEEGLSIEKIT